MHRTTLDRFAKQHNIPANQLDTVLVDQLVGANKDIRKVYKQLEALAAIREVAKASGKSLQDVLDWLEQP